MLINPMAPLSSYMQNTKNGWLHEHLRKVHQQITNLSGVISAHSGSISADLKNLEEISDIQDSLSNLQTAVESTENILDNPKQEAILTQAEEQYLPSNEMICELIELIEMTPDERETYLSNKKKRRQTNSEQLKKDRTIQTRKTFDRPINIQDKILTVLAGLAKILEITANSLVGISTSDPTQVLTKTKQLLSSKKNSTNLSLAEMIYFEDCLNSSVLESYLHEVSKMLDDVWEQVPVGAYELEEKIEAFPKKPSPYK